MQQKTRFRWCLAKDIHTMKSNEDGRLYEPELNHGSPSIAAEEIFFDLWHNSDCEQFEIFAQEITHYIDNSQHSEMDYVLIYTWRDGEFEKRKRYRVYPVLDVAGAEAYSDDDEQEDTM